ncbi:MAG: hypothetical protein R3190_19800 [Thermoanaerobaculia bacterium]|nr:hypothetical protein [Thermoanaerobaculia bacterium]
MIRVDGELSAAAAETIGEILRSLPEAVRSRTLDLTCTGYADGVGVAFLRDAERRGIELRGASPFIAARMARVDRREQRTEPSS